MAAVGAAFMEYMIKFIIYLAVAGVGIFAGIKLRASRQRKKSEK